MVETQWHGAESIVAAVPHPHAQAPVQHEEEVGYLQQGAEQIYCVRHRPLIPRIGQVLLASPFAPSRERVYISWVRWARFLAANGLEALRFDYRGTGESSGKFAQMDLDAWFEDVRCCARWLQEQGDGCPLVLHGLELGALLASRTFEKGVGSALLLWSAPSSAREVLCRALQLQRIQQYALGRESPRRTGDDCAAELEAGRSVMVNGSTWSSRLWKHSSEYVLPRRKANAGETGCHGGRPCKAIDLDETAGPLYLSAMGGRAVGRGGQLDPNLAQLFRANVNWIRDSLMRSRGECETDPSR